MVLMVMVKVMVVMNTDVAVDADVSVVCNGCGGHVFATLVPLSLMLCRFKTGSVDATTIASTCDGSQCRGCHCEYDRHDIAAVRMIPT